LRIFSRLMLCQPINPDFDFLLKIITISWAGLLEFFFSANPSIFSHDLPVSIFSVQKSSYNSLRFVLHWFLLFCLFQECIRSCFGGCCDHQDKLCLHVCSKCILATENGYKTQFPYPSLAVNLKFPVNAIWRLRVGVGCDKVSSNSCRFLHRNWTDHTESLDTCFLIASKKKVIFFYYNSHE
jgi:hypothetical protein